jgi:threonine dehydrogenase-like Zn-dependent dehydrogenase
MKAAVNKEGGGGLDVRDMPERRHQDRSGKSKNSLLCICGSELHSLDLSTPQDHHSSKLPGGFTGRESAAMKRPVPSSR